MIRKRLESSRGYFQGLPENEGLSKRTFLKVVGFACLGIIPFLNACGIVNSGDANPGSAKKPDGPATNGSVPKAARRKTKVFTEVLPYNGFYLAEGYHQKYYLRQHPDLMREFTAMYPRERELINSTAAARVNGYVAGYGTYENLLSEVSSFGLSPEESKKLLERVHKLHR